MTKTFTENDLVRFLYNEVSTDERLDIEESLVTNQKLQGSLNELMEATELLDTFSIKAPDDVVGRILYAEKHISST
ncbi:MAG: hypothetical protein AAGA66_07625 [Bacteroidota bacterium]